MKQPAIEEVRQAAEYGVPRRRAHVAVAVFFVVGGLLNGENLLRRAELLEHGRPLRTACVAAARPLAALSRATRLDRPRRWVEDWMAPFDTSIKP